tara:strand:- start:161 stop:319 length:159 start_codon:yes stop_codon:yes gene_type:complete
MVSTLEAILWAVFILGVSLLFFAAFGSDRVSNQTIDEYMENLIQEEENKRGT